MLQVRRVVQRPGRDLDKEHLDPHHQYSGRQRQRALHMVNDQR